jgi:hypothetical protein
VVADIGVWVFFGVRLNWLCLWFVVPYLLIWLSSNKIYTFAGWPSLDIDLESTDKMINNKWYPHSICRYQGTKRYQASLVMFVDIWDFFPRFYFPLSSLFSASETFFPRGSCAHAKKMRRYKRKRKEILEVWEFSARLRKLKIIFQVYHQEISCLNY